MFKLNHWIGLEAHKKKITREQPAPGPALVNSTILFIKLREQLKPFNPWPHVKDKITARLRKR